jgi:hypothetical protein
MTAPSKIVLAVLRAIVPGFDRPIRTQEDVNDDYPDVSLLG